MDNQKYIDTVIADLAKWEKIEGERRSYERESWHCVDVKRYNDSVSEKEIRELAAEVAPDDQHKQKILFAYAKDLIGEVSYNSVYNDWLTQQWDQLNYEITDIEELTKGSADEHKAFKHITMRHWRAKTDLPILSLGRSGGWACFQMDTDGTAEELACNIDSIVDKDNKIIEKDPETLEEILAEIREHHSTLMETIEEIQYIKYFIKKLNDGLDYKDEIKFRMEQKLEDLPELIEIQAYDNGGASVDRYTIINGDDAYGMSADAKTPLGFNQYIGSTAKLDRKSLGDSIAFETLPEEVKDAVYARIAG